MALTKVAGFAKWVGILRAIDKIYSQGGLIRAQNDNDNAKKVLHWTIQKNTVLFESLQKACKLCSGVER